MWRQWMIHAGLWLARLGGWELPAPSAPAPLVPGPVLAQARALTWAIDASPMGGEAKRHAVYAQLIKLFPAVSKRDLALAIELALKEG